MHQSLVSRSVRELTYASLHSSIGSETSSWFIIFSGKLVREEFCHFFPRKRLIPFIGTLRFFRVRQKRRIEMNGIWNWSRIALALMFVCMICGTPFLWAQTLGTAPQFNVAVQGQTGAQPEGAFFNFINWIGNVVAPVGAGGAVFGAVV